MKPERMAQYSPRHDAYARRLWAEGSPWPEGWTQEPSLRWIARGKALSIAQKMPFSDSEIEHLMHHGVDLFQTYGYSVSWYPGVPWACIYNEWIATGTKEVS
jgi:hypothetical protein